MFMEDDGWHFFPRFFFFIRHELADPGKSDFSGEKPPVRAVAFPSRVVRL